MSTDWIYTSTWVYKKIFNCVWSSSTQLKQTHKISQTQPPTQATCWSLSLPLPFSSRPNLARNAIHPLTSCQSYCRPCIRLSVLKSFLCWLYFSLVLSAYYWHYFVLRNEHNTIHNFLHSIHCWLACIFYYQWHASQLQVGTTFTRQSCHQILGKLIII